MEKKKIVIRIWTVALVVLAAVAVIIPVMSICTGAFEPNMTAQEMIDGSFDDVYKLIDGRTVLSYCDDTEVSADEYAQTYKIIRSYSEFVEFVELINNLDGYDAEYINGYIRDSGKYDKEYFRKNDLILVEQQLYGLTNIEEIYCQGDTLHITFYHIKAKTDVAQLYMIPVSGSVSASIDKIELSFFTNNN